MRVIIPVNELQEGEESVTLMSVDFGEVSERVAKRKSLYDNINVLSKSTSQTRSE